MGCALNLVNLRLASLKEMTFDTCTHLLPESFLQFCGTMWKYPEHHQKWVFFSSAGIFGASTTISEPALLNLREFDSDNVGSFGCFLGVLLGSHESCVLLAYSVWEWGCLNVFHRFSLLFAAADSLPLQKNFLWEERTVETLTHNLYNCPSDWKS